MNLSRCLLVAMLLAPGWAEAAPELNVGGLYDYLEAGKSTSLKRVRNGGDATAFVKVSAAELVYDDKGVSHEVELDGLALEQRGLIVSPARLIVPARGMQAVRLLYKGERERERYYRLRFIPVLPEQGDGFAVTEAEAETYRDSLRAGVNLLAGYGTLLFVRPAEPRYATRSSATGGKLSVVNDGNSTVVLDHLRVCEQGTEVCGPSTKQHVLPGRSRVIDGTPGHVFQFELHEGEQHRSMTVQG
ncbi:pilus assembly protein [Pseudomonas cremoricolorata]|uniref:Pilus assembly protein n=1 Tax=Pseudomonas cremoricolorata TaxID=157783 RepID=A0A089WR17_9PSED|nr:pilus assembly protein [Pseudomonas cremoricolorata]